VSEESNTQDAITAGMVIAARKDLPNGRGMAVVMPEGADAHVFDFEEYEAKPSRRRGSFAFHDAASFSAYIALQGAEGTELLMADRERYLIEAALDAHGLNDAAAGWHQHRALFKLRPTKPWLTWIGKNGAYVAQADFAAFIEDNMPDIVDPDGASILEVAKTLQIKNNVLVKSAVRLDTGEQQFTYEDNHSARGGVGMIQIPSQFILGLVPFEGCETYKVAARLRYRLQEGRLLLGYALIRHDRVADDAFDTVVKNIEDVTEASILAGSMPAKV